MRRRWLFVPGVAVLALGTLAAGVETVLERVDRRAYNAQGRLIDVGGYRLHLRCEGTGSPTVVLIPGAGETSASWAWIAPEVARQTRVCVYDRAGRAQSEPAGGPQDGIALARDLHTLLERAGERDQLVLVGHSVGGLSARVYAAQYPSQVSGVVFLDATHPDMFTRVPAYPRFYAVYRRVSALLPALARVGVGRVVYRGDFDGLPPEARAEQRAYWSTAALARSQRDEWAQLPEVMRQAGQVTSLGARPVIVVTAARDAQEGWMALQEELAQLSTNRAHVVTQASHMSLIVERSDAEWSTAAIRDVVTAVRTGRPLGQP